MVHRGWANGLHTVDLEYEPAQSLSDTLWNANFLTDYSRSLAGAPQGGVQRSGGEEGDPESESEPGLVGTLLKAGEQGDGPQREGHKETPPVPQCPQVGEAWPAVSWLSGAV